MVALRLYSRKWGPASIVNALNDHRQIEPTYLRNTCSVKFTTSIKKGRDKFGEDWERTNRDIFSEADDIRATDLIQLSEEEEDFGVDYDIQDLCLGLKKHPEEHVDGGIFTRCVKYCEANNAPYTMNDVWELAADLEMGRTPKHHSSQSGTLSSLESPSARASNRKAVNRGVAAKRTKIQAVKAARQAELVVDQAEDGTKEST